MKMKVACLLSVAVAVLALGSGSAMGFLTITDGFEDAAYSTGAFADTSGDYDPATPNAVGETVTGLGPQYAGGTVDDYGQVTRYTAGSGNLDPGPNSGNGYMRLVRGYHDGGNVQMFYSLSGMESASNPVTISFYVNGQSDLAGSDPGGYGRSNPSGATGISFSLDHSGGATDDMGFFCGLSDYGSTAISWDYNDQQGGGWTATGSSITLNSWKQVKIEVNSWKVGAVLGTLDFWYDGVEYTNIPNNATEGASFMIGTGGGIEYYLDDVSITEIPEPVTLALLSAGGVLALLGRRRRAA
ncbi:MAG: PEP-CTERM sorting domain-containing protein [Actinobacteria bacterium]|nr:PEP-CTERM sorting domain-containing protein [Actinomycetota bacterium]